MSSAIANNGSGKSNEQNSVDNLTNEVQSLSLNSGRTWKDIPTPIKNYICSFLSTQDIACNVSRVHRDLADILTAQTVVTLSNGQTKKISNQLADYPSKYLIAIALKVTSLKFTLHGSGFNDSGLILRLPFFKKLKELDCSAYSSGAFLPALTRSIKTLTLSAHFSLSDFHLEELRSFPHLEFLSLSGKGLTGSSFVQFPPTLQTLKLRCKDVVTEHLHRFTKCVPSCNLHLLWDNADKLVAEMLAALKKGDQLQQYKEVAEKVTSLNFMFSELSEDQLAKVLPYFDHLEKLVLLDTAITGSCLDVIVPSIQSVVFGSSCTMSFAALLKFSDKHPQCEIAELPGNLAATLVINWLEEPLQEIEREAIQRIAMRVKRLVLHIKEKSSKQREQIVIKRNERDAHLSSKDKQQYDILDKEISTQISEWTYYTDADLEKIFALFRNLQWLEISSQKIIGRAFKALPLSMRQLYLSKPNEQAMKAAELLRPNGIEVKFSY